jgi:hypothetical protein
LTPPPEAWLPAVSGVAVAPEQVWLGLSPTLQAALRQTALCILREVADAAH